MPTITNKSNNFPTVEIETFNSGGNIFLDLIYIQEKRFLFILSDEALSLTVIPPQYNHSLVQAYEYWSDNSELAYTVNSTINDTTYPQPEEVNTIYNSEYIAELYTNDDNFILINKYGEGYFLTPYVNPYFFPMDNKEDVKNYLLWLAGNSLQYHLDDNPNTIYWHSKDLLNDKIAIRALNINHYRLWELVNPWELLEEDRNLASIYMDL